MDQVLGPFERDPPCMTTIVCNGPHGVNKTPSGVSYDILISAIQKYARRKMLNRGVKCLVDLHCLMFDPRFVDAATSKADVGRIKAVATNLRRRILVMSVEDCIHPAIYAELVRIEGAFKSDAIGASSMAALLSMYALVTHADKGRLPSIAKLIVDPPEDVAWREAHKGDVFLDDELGSETRFKALLVDGDFRSLRLLPQDPKRAFELVMDAARSLDVKGMRSAVAALKELHAVMKGHKEAQLFVYQAVAVVVFRKENLQFERLPAAYSAVSPDAAVATYREHVTTPKIAVDEFCIDMHTRAGRMGMGGKAEGSLKFATEGSFVEDELPCSSSKRKMYEDSKRVVVSAARCKDAKKEPKRSKLGTV